MTQPFDDIHHIPGKDEFTNLMTKENVTAAILSMAATHTHLTSQNDILKLEIEALRRDLHEAQKTVKAVRNICDKSDKTIARLRRINRHLMDGRWQALRMVPHYGVDLARETWDEDGVIVDVEKAMRGPTDECD